jgi:SAM-dependent methyltransferase
VDRDSLARGYAPVAAAYAEALGNELAGKPLDRALLSAFAEECRGPILEVGCGPGQIARFLRDRGADVQGIDLSPEMIAEARRKNPDVEFTVADMHRLPHADQSLAGIVSFYAIVHSRELDFRELHRVLRPGGLALIAFHVGEQEVHVEDLFGVATSLDFHFHPVEAVASALAKSGFSLRATLVREPYPQKEHPSRRAYLLAQSE